MLMFERIRCHIKSNGMLISFVADQAEIDRKKFYRLVNGKTEISLGEYEKICNGLKVEPSFFYNENISLNEKDGN